MSQSLIVIPGHWWPTEGSQGRWWWTPGHCAPWSSSSPGCSGRRPAWWCSEWDKRWNFGAISHGFIYVPGRDLDHFLQIDFRTFSLRSDRPGLSVTLTPALLGRSWVVFTIDITNLGGINIKSRYQVCLGETQQILNFDQQTQWCSFHIIEWINPILKTGSLRLRYVSLELSDLLSCHRNRNCKM